MIEYDMYSIPVLNNSLSSNMACSRVRLPTINHQSYHVSVIKYLSVYIFGLFRLFGRPLVAWLALAALGPSLPSLLP